MTSEFHNPCMVKNIWLSLVSALGSEFWLDSKIPDLIRVIFRDSCLPNKVCEHYMENYKDSGLI